MNMDLSTLIAGFPDRLARHARDGQGLGRFEVSAELVEPVLAALGFALDDSDALSRPSLSNDASRCGFGLHAGGALRLLVEVRDLSENIDAVDLRDEALASCIGTRTSWIMLTNGALWRILSTRLDTNEVPHEYLRFDLSDPASAPMALDVLSHLDRWILEDLALEELLWCRRGRNSTAAVLERLGPYDPDFVRLVRSRLARDEGLPQLEDAQVRRILLDLRAAGSP